MRGRALLPILLTMLVLAPAVEAAGWKLLAHRWHDEPGWHSERFQVDEFGTIKLILGIDSDDEFAGSVVALFADSGTPIATIILGNAEGQLVDLRAGSGAVVVSNEDLPGLGTPSSWEQTMYLTCNATCNPSRVFKLAVSGAGELDAWGYGLFVRNGTILAHDTGSAAWAIPSREIPGVVSAHATALGAGPTAVVDGALDLDVAGTLVGGWVKDPSAPAQRMAIVLPNDAGEVACTCVMDGWASGEYGLRYRDADAFGREAYFIAADVELP